MNDDDIITTTCHYCKANLGMCRRGDAPKSMVDHVKQCVGHPMHVLMVDNAEQAREIRRLQTLVRKLKKGGVA